MTGMCRRPRRRSCDRRPAARTRTTTRQSGETCPHATGAAPPRRCTATCAATPHATRVIASPGGPGPAPARAPVRVRARALARNRASAGREAGPRAMSRSSGGASGAVGWRTTTAAAGAHARTPWIGAGDTRGTIGRSPRGVPRAPAATGPLPSERPRRGSGCPTSPTPGACCGYLSLNLRWRESCLTVSCFLLRLLPKIPWRGLPQPRGRSQMAEVRPALFCTLHAVSDAGPLRRLMGYDDDPKIKTQRALPPPRAAYIPTQTMRLVGSQLSFLSGVAILVLALREGDAAVQGSADGSGWSQAERTRSWTKSLRGKDRGGAIEYVSHERYAPALCFCLCACFAS
eukprot:COSAG04_NODE_385_length_15323_cov_3.045586_6_plen_345_part_00